MAFKLADALVYLGTDDNKLKSGLDGAKTQTEGFATTATKLIGGVVVGAAVAAGAAIISIGAGALSVSEDTMQAANQMAASLRLPLEEAQKFADVARDVYAKGLGETVGDAAVAVEALAKQMKLAADDPALQSMTESALRLRNTFGVDVTESIDAVKTLMENFGLSGDEAFDLIAAGYQKGLNRSDDFLDTIGEYSVQFAAGGATAGEFFSLIDNGLRGGMLGTDKAADAFKEFRVRIADGSSLTADSLAMIGLSIDDITAGMSDGTLTAADAFQMVQDALNNTNDPVIRFQAGVGLLGTQFEDLGEQTALSLKMTDDWASSSQGAIDSLTPQYKNFGQMFELLWRRLTVSVSPLTDKLLELGNEVMPYVIAAFDAFDANVVPVIEGIGTAISTMVDFVKPLFASFQGSIEDATGPLAYWQEWAEINLPLVQVLFERVLGAIQTVWDLFGDDIETIITNTFDNLKLIIDTALKTIGDIITIALQLLNGDWEGAWETFKGALERIWETIKEVVSNQLDSLKIVFENIDWQAVGEALLNAVLAGIKFIWVDLNNFLIESLQNLWNAIVEFDWKSAGQSIISTTKSGAESAWTGLDNWFKTSFAGLYDYLNTTTWQQKGQDAINAAKAGTEIGWNIFKAYFGTQIDSLLTLFTGRDWTGTGSSLISNVQSGVTVTWNTFIAYMGELIPGIATLFSNINLDKVGEAIVEAIKAGIANKWGEFTSWFKLKLSELTGLLPFSEPKDSSSPLRNLGKSGKSFVSNWWEGAEKEFGSLKGSLAAGLGNIASTLNMPQGSQPAFAGATDKLTLNVYVNGKDATYEAGGAVGRGVLDELRRRGG